MRRLRDILTRDCVIKIGGILLLIIGLAALTYGIVWAVTYQRTITIEVKVRQWSYWAAVKYDTQETRLVTDVDTTCSGTGENRKCRTTTSVRTERYTVSHTRCQDTRYGNELPPVAPDLTCSPAPGDYRQEGVEYWIDYLEDGQKDPARHTFSFEMWDKLRPGLKRKVIVDLFGNIRQVVEE